MRLEQLIDVCRKLNEAQVRYVLVGGFAVLIHGYERATRDIDFIVDPSEENIAKIKSALSGLLPEACQELNPSDVTNYAVVRMGGEDIVVDLMHRIADLDYEKISRDIQVEQIGNIDIPVAGLDALIETKKGVRDQDKRDLLFLEGKREYLRRKE